MSHFAVSPPLLNCRRVIGTFLIGIVFSLYIVWDAWNHSVKGIYTDTGALTQSQHVGKEVPGTLSREDKCGLEKQGLVWDPENQGLGKARVMVSWVGGLK